MTSTAPADVAAPVWQPAPQPTFETTRAAEETVINLAAPPRSVEAEVVVPARPPAPPRPVEAEAVVPARPPAPPPRPRETLPPVSMSLPSDSGLELVETRSKGMFVPEPEPQVPAGPRRARPPRVVIQDEPLEIVETRKEGPPPAG
jgi:hypothetical protein